MRKLFKALLVIGALALVAAFVGPKSILAAPPAPIDVTGEPDTGSGTYELGQCITGSVTKLAKDVVLNVSLLDNWNSYPLEGLLDIPDFYWALPGAPGDLFSCVVNLKVMENNTMVEKFPTDKGSAEVCIDTPAGVEGFIYYLDVFQLKTKDPIWQEVGGPFPGGSRGCVPVGNTGVYAYYSPLTDLPVTGAQGATFLTNTQVGSVLVPALNTVLGGTGGLTLGGCATGNYVDLTPGKGYRVEAFVTEAPRNLPEKVGEFYECIVDVKFYQGDKLVDELPEEDGNMTLCFAVPPEEDGTVYYLDQYFAPETDWDPISESFKTGIACSPIVKSGVYGMVDVQ